MDDMMPWTNIPDGGWSMDSVADTSVTPADSSVWWMATSSAQRERNFRRWIIENDWLEAIIALPLKMFYNTGIATYVWVITNRKEERGKGKVQLIDATKWFTPLRKNLGEKSVEISPTDAPRVVEYQPDTELRDTEQVPLAEIRAEIRALEAETNNLIAEIAGEG